MFLRIWFRLIVLALTIICVAGHSAIVGPNCESLLLDSARAQQITHSSFNKVLSIMSEDPYDPAQLPVIPIHMFKWIGNRLTFYVANRSRDILHNRQDFREVGMLKPIHAMGIGMVGKMTMLPTRWTGVFRGGEFHVLARASISQGNPFKFQVDGRPQVRSTAMGIKVFGAQDPDADSWTANAVFQNNLNGLLGSDGLPLNYLESAQTNQPALDFTKIDRGYQVWTLMGIAYASIVSPLDHMSKIPFINPQIRPVHSWAELGEMDPTQVRVPVWVKILPKLSRVPVNESDFRLEILKTMQRDGQIEYEIFAADQQDLRGNIQWERVGGLVFTETILAAGVDQKLLIPHDSFNSAFTGEKFIIPAPGDLSRGSNLVP